ncbi:MAG: AAA family ATPase [Pseudomonadota bacterium]
MDNSKDLRLVLQSKTPIIVIESHDEAQVLAMLADQVSHFRADSYRPIFRWTVTDGLQRLDIELEPQTFTAEPTEVLKHIRALTRPGIYVLLDYHPFLKDPVHVRLLKDIAITSEALRRTIILISHEIELPGEIERLSARFELALPNSEERAKIVQEVTNEYASENPGVSVKVDPKAFELLVKNLSGLTSSDTRRLARNAIFNDGAVSRSDLPQVMESKYQLLNTGGVLSYEYDTAKFSDIGGLKQLKTWLEKRKAAFRGNIKLQKPKGIMLLGVQGCGKSLAAKAAAGVFGVPLLKLDFSVLYNKFHGETERNLRESLATASVMAPCVLWIDEIEKTIASGSEDSGTSRRVLGTFLTWMSEKTKAVFVVATANDVRSLPPELMRKGRFDETFFVDLPTPSARMEIFRLHLEQREIDPATMDMVKLVKQSDGFSGAEIEQAIVSASYTALAHHRDLDTGLLVNELKGTYPLSVTMAESVAALRLWAKDRAVPSG